VRRADMQLLRPPAGGTARLRDESVSTRAVGQEPIFVWDTPGTLAINHVMDIQRVSALITTLESDSVVLRSSRRPHSIDTTGNNSMQHK
jgi:hypothetical protein